MMVFLFYLGYINLASRIKPKHYLMDDQITKNNIKPVTTIILAAGYATRLYPLTLTKPKPLLSVADRPIVEHIIERLHPETGKVYFVINEKFVTHFGNCQKNYIQPTGLEIKLINDGSKDETDKLGAIGDLCFVLDSEQIDTDVLVVAGDNIFTEKLDDFYEFAKNKNAPVLAVYDVGSLELAKKYSSITTDKDGKLIFFEEKSPNPKTTMIGIALYYYPKEVLSHIRQYIEEGNNPDQPGRLIQWLYQKMPVYTWALSGKWYDIGTKETLDTAEKYFSSLKNLEENILNKPFQTESTLTV